MAVRRVYITTAEDFPPSAHTHMLAESSETPEILSGIPSNLADMIPPLHTGIFDIVIPDPPEPTPDPLEALQAQVADLTAQLVALTEDPS